jgi:hypothetical protein
MFGYGDVRARMKDGKTGWIMVEEREGAAGGDQAHSREAGADPRGPRWVSVANIEGGNQRILSHTLVQLAAALNIEATDILPPKPETSVANNNSQITNELVTKLGISVSAAKKLAGKAKKS